jgi:hypothetical protein
MAAETKDDVDAALASLESAAAPVPVAAPQAPAVLRRGAPPRWRAPLAADKGVIKRTALPTDLFERFETSTAAAPLNIPAETIGVGVGIAGPPGDELPAAPRAPRAPAAPDLVPAAPRAPRALPAPALPALPAPEFKVPLTEPLKELADHLLDSERSKIGVHPKDALFVPQNRRAFKQFVIQSYWRYKLADVPLIPDPDACAKAVEASKKEVKTFAYQSFVRDYMQRPSPYRGVLVYHGLGSGKTCTSIAALEALYQEHQRPIIVMTPASLQPNYRDEISKCGPAIFRLASHWKWIAVPDATRPTPESELLLRVAQIPIKTIRANKGGWFPDPALPSNYETLSPPQRAAIQKQIMEIMDARFKFINYNGITTETVRSWACPRPDPADPEREITINPFDGATVIIDEVHNLVRTINNSGLETYYKTEPRSAPEFKPTLCKVGGKYSRSYLLYRMLCDAVGAKIIALSATPIINFPQEVAILANMLAGDHRIAETLTPVIAPAKRDEMLRLLKFHPEVDYVELVPRGDGSGTSTLRITPVPSGFRKVADPATGELRGFVRSAVAADDAERVRERDLPAWYARVVTAIKEAGIGVLATDATFGSFQRLPDLEKPFRDIFVDTDSLEIKPETKYVLMARLSGLVSYYKGGKADLMATSKEYIVPVDMSDAQLKEYTTVRNEEISRERTTKKKPTKSSLYDQATQSVNSTFKIFSRAACNFTFPTDIPRPKPQVARDQLKMIGARIGASGDEVGDEADRTLLDPEGALYDRAAAAAPPIAEEEAAAGAGATTYEAMITAAIAALRARRDEFFSPASLKRLSPKFQAIIDRLKTSAGPALVYSNFKTLEGVGLFGVALETQERYAKLDIIQVAGGEWRLSAETVAGGTAAPRYISYTGDEDREKRNILLAIFNAKWAKVPGALAAQVQELCGVKDNKAGQICRVFMITQSGAEGISLSNVRQVHIMEPYWNYVRLDQVKGRAIRICSHMDLPSDQRHVDTYIYLSRFSERQRTEKLVDMTLLNFDEGLTTDETVWRLMNAKKKLADSITDVMKRAAVDCELNATENGGYACYRFDGAAASMYPLYFPQIERNIAEGASTVRAAAGAGEV